MQQLSQNKFHFIFISFILFNTTSNISLFYTLETVAFHTVLTSNPTIPDESPVLFDEVLINEGDG